ncbi:hypothetical protein F0562_029216 [Nyssa sinensis]|uniref:Uncharacterized protein n=1 Tax=Nyssa sinensis TaxID=561372 RepID=A0A5J5B298_9ASTE|nr:hypothetical protein F0562_029216 [Nyssa sinensis]
MIPGCRIPAIRIAAKEVLSHSEWKKLDLYRSWSIEKPNTYLFSLPPARNWCMLFFLATACVVLLFSSSNSLAQEERGLPIKGLKALFNKIFQTGIPKGFKFSKDTIEKIKKYTDFVSKIVDEECKEKSNGQYCLPPNNKCFQCKGPICKALCSYDYFAKNFQKQCQICNN